MLIVIGENTEIYTLHIYITVNERSNFPKCVGIII